MKNVKRQVLQWRQSQYRRAARCRHNCPKVQFLEIALDICQTLSIFIAANDTMNSISAKKISNKIRAPIPQANDSNFHLRANFELYELVAIASRF
jgi:hypothetical protein